MTRIRTTAVFNILLMLGIALLVSFRTPSKAVVSSPATATTAHLVPLDLSAFYDKDRSFDAPGCWQAVPRGVHTFANIPFRIEGLIQLWGAGPETIGRRYRESVEGIPLTGKFQTLYVLHGSSFITPDGTPIAEVIFHYSDRTAATNRILYGTDSRDWWEPLAERSPMPTNSVSRIIWRGDHPSLPDWVRCLRLFGTAMPNPKPDVEVTGIDLVSSRSRTTWVVLALTTGPSGALKVEPELEKNEHSTEQIVTKLTAVDSESGKPIPDMQFRITLTTGRRPRPYGIFTADEHGECIIELPPQRIRLLAIEVFSTNYYPEQASWNPDKGEAIPTNYIFKATKEAQ